MSSNSTPAVSLLGNRYQLQETIGKGGTAVIYRARDLMLERTVAVKVLRHDFSEDDGFRERFRQEARAAANLSHPNIVTVHDFGLDKGRLYIVMEYVPGIDLKTTIRQHGRFTIDEAIPLMVQACAGIGYAHRAGLIHCDVKPHNMLVTPDQHLKVTDFGIARALASVRPDEQYDQVWGSPQYFSPEQAAGAAPSPASDVYSLGVILYEMLTGVLPFNASDPTELARLHRDAEPLPPRHYNPQIPLNLEQIILKVLSKEPSARYRAADQLGRILTTFSAQADLYAASIPGPLPQAYSITTATMPTTVAAPTNAPQAAKNPAATGFPDFDWLTLGLGLLTVIAVGGLIPFWLYIWLTLNSLPPTP